MSEKEKTHLNHRQFTEYVFDKLLAFVNPQLLPGAVKGIHTLDRMWGHPLLDGIKSKAE